MIDSAFSDPPFLWRPTIRFIKRDSDDWTCDRFGYFGSAILLADDPFHQARFSAAEIF